MRETCQKRKVIFVGATMIEEDTKWKETDGMISD